MLHITKWVLSIVVALVLVACGGGGAVAPSGDSSTVSRSPDSGSGDATSGSSGGSGSDGATSGSSGGSESDDATSGSSGGSESDGATSGSSGGSESDGATSGSSGGSESDGATSGSSGGSESDGATSGSSGGGGSDGATSGSSGGGGSDGATSGSSGGSGSDGATSGSSGGSESDGATSGSSGGSGSDGATSGSSGGSESDGATSGSSGGSGSDGATSGSSDGGGSGDATSGSSGGSGGDGATSGSSSGNGSDGATSGSSSGGGSDGATSGFSSGNGSDGATSGSSGGSGSDGATSSFAASVRIGIHDSGVDINHPQFATRVATSGVDLLYPTTLQPPSNSCVTSSSNNLCLFVASSTSPYLTDDVPSACIGANAERQACARAMLAGAANNIPTDSIQTLYIYDRSANTTYRLPSASEMRHGTIVASLAARHSVGTTITATIVPLSINISGQRQASDRGITFLDLLTGVINGNIDILNRSFGIDQGNDYEEMMATFESATPGHELRDYWEAFAQVNVATSDKVVQVWAAGNEGGSILNETAILPYYYDALRDHWIAVVATGSDDRIAYYSNRCGQRTADGVAWDESAHGVHFCIAAPGDGIDAALPNGQTSASGLGTSFAAPRVSGAIAAVMINARNQVPAVEALQRVKQTADDSGIYAETMTYGVGLLNLNAALTSVGDSSISAANGQRSAVGNAALSTASVYGAAVLQGLQGVEIAAFDELNYPFWHDAAKMVKTSRIPLPSAWEGWGDKEEPTLERSGLLKPLRWFDLNDRQSGALRMTVNRHTFGLSAAPFGDKQSRWADLRLGFIADNETHHGARASGAFASRVRSGMVFAGFERLFKVKRGGTQSSLSRWSLHTRLTFAAGKANYAEGALFDASGSLFSSAALALRYADEKRHTRLQIEQPLRAESGEGVLHYAYGRTTGGTPVYRHHRFSLVPDARAFHISLGHEHAIGDGRLTLQLLHVLNRDHIRGQRYSRISAGYQLRW